VLGTFETTQRAALIDTHCLRSAFLGLCAGKKHRDGARHFFPDHPASILFGIHLQTLFKLRILRKSGVRHAALPPVNFLSASHQ